MKKQRQIIFFLLLLISLLLPSNIALGQDEDGDETDFWIAIPFSWGINLAAALDGKDDLDTLRSIRDSYQRDFDDMITNYENNERYQAADIGKVLRGGFMRVLNARVKLAEERTPQASSSATSVISAVLTNGAAAVNANAPAEPNPIIDKILPILQNQTKQNATDLLHGYIASRIPENGAEISENSSSNNVNIYKPLRFKNNGAYDVTVLPATFTPDSSVVAVGMSNASTVVFRDSSPTAYLDLPMGTYTFCYYWDLGTDVDQDGYVDYAHKNTGSVILSEASPANVISAQVVTLNPGNMETPNGKCGETAPLPSENTGELTPQELANQGTYTYRIDCPSEEISVDNPDATVLTFKFVDGGVEETYAGYTDFFQRIHVNTYDILISDPDGTSWTYTYTFTNAGFNVILVGGGERCEPSCFYQSFHYFCAHLAGAGSSETCTAIRE